MYCMETKSRTKEKTTNKKRMCSEEMAAVWARGVSPKGEKNAMAEKICAAAHEGNYRDAITAGK